MARIARIVLPNVPLHLIQRGNNRQACFVAEQDYRYYLKLLSTNIAETCCRVHAYVLMTNHVHLLVTPPTKEAVSVMMKAVAQRYTQYFNKKYNRSGTLWQGRFRSSPTQTQEYFLACQRYIELNPVRACMAHDAAAYRWSSYHANGLGHVDKIVTPHAIYLALGPNQMARQEAYRALCATRLSEHVVAHIRQACKGTCVLGNADFAAAIAAACGRAAHAARPAGRPRSKKA